MYIPEELKAIVFEAVCACTKELDAIAPGKYDAGPINSALSAKLEKCILNHLEDYQTKD